MKGQDRSNNQERKRNNCGGPGADPIGQEAKADHGYRPYGPGQAHDDSGAHALAIGQNLLRQHHDGGQKRQVE